jgi:threonine aldolase
MSKSQSDSVIDLRSDTVTKPSAAMMQAILHAELGDDVIDIDPTIQQLQKLTAEMLGKEAALFMPSGSMTNQIAIRIHCQPGDEFLCESDCHIYNYEQAAFAQLSGLVARCVPGKFGVLHLDQLKHLIRPEADHLVRTRLVCLENTHNRGGGKVWPFEQMKDICKWAHSEGLRTHLDGARLFNAVVASGIEARKWSSLFDSVSVCFSKGLGAPVGSALAGTADFIQKARRARKLFGGGMRQAGIIAAGALFALENNCARLVEDHENAQLLAQTIRTCEGLSLEPDEIDSNIVIFRIDPKLSSAIYMTAQLKDHGVLSMPFGPQLVRLVTHLDVSRDQTVQACDIIRRVVSSAFRSKVTR